MEAVTERAKDNISVPIKTVQLHSNAQDWIESIKTHLQLLPSLNFPPQPPTHA